MPWQHMVYTGPIDAFFDHRYGKLPYRSLEFEHVNLPQEQFQPVGTVNYPNDYAYTRITEFKHLTGQEHAEHVDRLRVPAAPRAIRTTRCRAPRTPRSTSATRRWPSSTPNVTFVGRLATYRYYNMDQVVGQALAAFKRLQASAGSGRPARTRRPLASNRLRLAA